MAWGYHGMGGWGLLDYVRRALPVGVWAARRVHTNIEVYSYVHTQVWPILCQTVDVIIHGGQETCFLKNTATGCVGNRTQPTPSGGRGDPPLGRAIQPPHPGRTPTGIASSGFLPRVNDVLPIIPRILMEVWASARGSPPLTKIQRRLRASPTLRRPLARGPTAPQNPPVWDFAMSERGGCWLRQQTSP